MQRAAIRQNWPDLPGRSVKAHLSELRGAIVIFQIVSNDVPTYEIRKPSMRNTHAFGFTCRTGGINNIDQILRRHSAAHLAHGLHRDDSSVPVHTDFRSLIAREKR